jgi:hypothetical protein
MTTTPFPRVPDDVKTAGYHYLVAITRGGQPCWRCDACGKEFATRDRAAAELCSVYSEKLFTHCAEFLNVIKGVLKTDKEKFMPIAGAVAGRWIKRRIDPTEKLVRILAALYSLDPTFFEAIDFEARNRILVAQISGRKPWG